MQPVAAGISPGEIRDARTELEPLTASALSAAAATVTIAVASTNRRRGARRLKRSRRVVGVRSCARAGFASASNVITSVSTIDSHPVDGSPSGDAVLHGGNLAGAANGPVTTR